MRIPLQHFLWTIPFLCFTLGYWLPYCFFAIPNLKVPNLLGKNVLTALEIASHNNLSLKLLRTQEDESVAAGTVLFQTPSPSRNAKPHQTILIIASCQKPQPVTPSCIGLTTEDALTLLKTKQIIPRMLYVPTQNSYSKVLSQNPSPESILNTNDLTLYIEEPTKSLVIMPQCQGFSITEAVDFFALHGLTYELQRSCTHNPIACSCTITEQRPLAGTCIDLKKAPIILLSTKH